jgi:hypothetical protein
LNLEVAGKNRASRFAEEVWKLGAPHDAEAA